VLSRSCLVHPMTVLMIKLFNLVGPLWWALASPHILMYIAL
jgi:hypothetical protein